MLVSVVSEELGGGRSLPVFVAQAESPAKVIQTLLSVYHRRHRLPEPSEIYFCTGNGLHELESISLVIQRWAHAKLHGGGERVFCVANIQNLTYTQQCAIVEHLRTVITEHGTEQVPTLTLTPTLILIGTINGNRLRRSSFYPGNRDRS